MTIAKRRLQKTIAEEDCKNRSSFTWTSRPGRGFAIVDRASDWDSDLAAPVFDLDFDSAVRLGLASEC
jgi:hypothetical protein